MDFTELEDIQKLKFVRENEFCYCNPSKSQTFEGAVMQSLLEKIIIHRYRLGHIFNQLKYESDKLFLNSVKTILLKIQDNTISIGWLYNFFESPKVVSEITLFGNNVLKKKNIFQAIKELAIEIWVFSIKEQNIRKLQPFDERRHLVIPILVTDSSDLEFMILYKKSEYLDNQMTFITFDQELSMKTLKSIFCKAISPEKIKTASRKCISSILEKFTDDWNDEDFLYIKNLLLEAKSRSSRKVNLNKGDIRPPFVVPSTKSIKASNEE